MKTFCVVKGDEFFIGEKSEIINQVCEFTIDQLRRVHFKFNGFKKEQLISYSEEYTQEEMYKDCIELLFNRLERYNYKIFVNYR
jgi:hypothetical protein